MWICIGCTACLFFVSFSSFDELKMLLCNSRMDTQWICWWCWWKRSKTIWPMLNFDMIIIILINADIWTDCHHAHVYYTTWYDCDDSIIEPCSQFLFIHTSTHTTRIMPPLVCFSRFFPNEPWFNQLSLEMVFETIKPQRTTLIKISNALISNDYQNDVNAQQWRKEAIHMHRRITKYKH